MQKKYLMKFALMTMIKTHRAEEELYQNDTSHMQLSMIDKYSHSLQDQEQSKECSLSMMLFSQVLEVRAKAINQEKEISDYIYIYRSNRIYR